MFFCVTVCFRSISFRFSNLKAFSRTSCILPIDTAYMKVVQVLSLLVAAFDSDKNWLSNVPILLSFVLYFSLGLIQKLFLIVK